MSSDMAGRMQDQIEGAISENERLLDLIDRQKALLAWAYGKLCSFSFSKEGDALNLDEIKMLLEHGE